MSTGLANVVAFATRTAARDLPAAVDAQARMLMLDTLGCIIGAFNYPPVQAMAAELVGAADLCGPDDAGALLTLGCAATWLDADSGGSHHPDAGRLPPVPTAHPAAHVLPGLLLHCATRSSTDLVRAFALAVEFGLRLSLATSLRPGLHPHGIHGPAAAALARAIVDGDDAGQALAAVRTGGALPLGATLEAAVRGATVRNAWTGLGSYYGASAATRAAAPTGAGDAYLTALYSEVVSDRFDPTALADGLGRDWEILRSYFKPYASARWTHPALDAVAAIMSESGRGAHDVVAVDVATFAFGASMSVVRPDTDLHARFSLPFCIATLLATGRLDARSFLPDQLVRADVIGLAERVSLAEDPEHTAAMPTQRPARVVIRWVDGTSSERSVRQARGNPELPCESSEVVAKFRSNAHGIIADAQIDRLVDAVLDPGSDPVRELGTTTRDLFGRGG